MKYFQKVIKTDNSIWKLPISEVSKRTGLDPAYLSRLKSYKVIASDKVYKKIKKSLT